MLSQKILLSNKRILVCPLDWGLGHAARCVPLINHLQKQDNTIIIACNEKQKEFLCNEVSNVEYVDLFGYDVRYSKNLSLWIKMVLQFPRLCAVVRKENQWLQRYILENKIDVVISDNRFGLYSNEVESIFITHQLFVKAPFFQRLINRMNQRFIGKFTQCWVPDFEEDERALSGDLSHGKNINSHILYIGPLSRFDTLGTKEIASDLKNDILILLSGVEPQRTILEDKLVIALKNTDLKIVLVRGTSEPAIKNFPANIEVINIATTIQLGKLLLNSKNIICRSGYSTLMDLHALGLKAILVPTPGQTEQEYLAKYWEEKFNFDVLKQDEITKETILSVLR